MRAGLEIKWRKCGRDLRVILDVSDLSNYDFYATNRSLIAQEGEADRVGMPNRFFLGIAI